MLSQLGLGVVLSFVQLDESVGCLTSFRCSRCSSRPLLVSVASLHTPQFCVRRQCWLNEGSLSMLAFTRSASVGNFFVVFEGGDHIEDAISSFIPRGRLYAALLRGETAGGGTCFDSSLRSASPTCSQRPWSTLGRGAFGRQCCTPLDFGAEHADSWLYVFSLVRKVSLCHHRMVDETRFGMSDIIPLRLHC